MDAAGHGEPVGEGQEEKGEVSDDSDSGHVIIELDQSQIASPSDSEEEGQLQESPSKPDVSDNKQSEYFDTVSDCDDIPDDDAGPTAASNNESAAEQPTKDTVQDDLISAKDTLAEGNAGSLSQGSEAMTEGCEAADSGEHKEEGEAVDSCPQTSVANSGSTDEAAKDSLVPEHVIETPADRTLDVLPTPPNDLLTEKPTGEGSQDKVSGEDVDVPCPEDVSDAAQGKGTSEENTAVKSSTDLSAIADDVSDVSSEGESPLSPVEEDDKPSAEKLSQEAAHQAEALASLGAEPVSEPESGEDMGSDESSPVNSPGFSSPVVVTSSSRISLGSGDFADARARATSRSPRKSDSAVISDCASSILPTDRSDRISLEDGIIPSTFSTSDNKLDLSASMDMENISDDENIGEDNDSEDTSGEIEDEPEVKADEAVSSSTQQAEEDGLKSSPGEKSVDGERVRRPIMIASLGDKQQVQTHFNEEQVELDYEDVEGDGDADEGEIKPEDEDGKEEGEDSDKDEGEIDDDDDCEEGEIKEPGTSKKPFFKPTCRFYQRGTCTWGLNCRFLHPGVNDKGNYQMIELPGQRWNGPPGHMGGAQWGPEPEEPVDLPPPPEVTPIESAWERGLRHAKEQMKKASQRKEQESNFEEKRLNLSVDEEREMNKENERRMVVHAPIVKDPYYDQAAFDEEEYYKQRGINNWQSGRYENFEVRYNRESYSPYTREKEYYPPPADRYPRHFSPPVDKFGRHPRMEPRPEPPYRSNRMEEMRALSPSPPVAAATPPSRRPADEWHDPWRRSKSPKANRRGRSRSRSRRGRRSLSDSSFSSEQKREKNTRAVAAVKANSSRSGSRSSGSRSRSSRSRSTGSSRSRSRSPEPAPPGVERGDRGERNYGPPGRYMDGPRSAVSVRGHGGGSHWRDQDGGRQGYHNRSRGGFQRGHNQDHRHRSGPAKIPERSFPPGYGYNRNRPQERRIPLDALRPKRVHSASSSGSSRSRSRSRSHSGSRSGSSSSYSRSRSGSARSRSLGSLSRSRSRSASSVSSHTSSSSSSSSGSADSDNLYRDLGGPSPKKKTVKGKEKVTEVGKVPRHPGQVPGKEKVTEVGKVPRHPGQVPVGRGDRKRLGADAIPRRPGGAPAPGADHPPRPRPDQRPDGRADRPVDARPERANLERADPATRMPHPGRPDRAANKAERVERVERVERAERGERPQRGERVDRPDRVDRERTDNSSHRPERVERPEHAERERGMVGVKPTREQSSRPPPPSLQPKAKDPMKLIGLKSNIKLSLVSKPGDKAAASAPLKRRQMDPGDGPPIKRPNLPASPVKMPSEKAAKPSAGRERVRSPSERQPRSGAAAIPASLPMAMAASIPLPPSPSKPPSAKPRPPPSKAPHPPPAVSKPTPPQPVPPPATAPPPAPARAAPAAPTPAPAASAAKAKKSTTSRREELLKQLKAVEDAIARKKAKMQ